jgi:hypothetical protein
LGSKFQNFVCWSLFFLPYSFSIVFSEHNKAFIDLF